MGMGGLAKHVNFFDSAGTKIQASEETQNHCCSSNVLSVINSLYKKLSHHGKI